MSVFYFVGNFQVYKSRRAFVSIQRGSIWKTQASSGKRAGTFCAMGNRWACSQAFANRLTWINTFRTLPNI